MQCHRCGHNVPDFLWVDGDHPILVKDSAKITRIDRDDNETVIFRLETLVKTTSCSDVYPPYLPTETKNVNGLVCVVIHFTEDHSHIRHHPDGRLFISACTGQYFMLPGQNDTRPVTICELCRKKALGE